MTTRRRPDLSAVERAYAHAAELVTKSQPASVAFDRATELADLLRDLAERAADVRAQMAARIADEERLSLAVLASRIGVSKARAGQLVQHGRRLDGDPAEGEGTQP